MQTDHKPKPEENGVLKKLTKGTDPVVDYTPRGTDLVVAFAPTESVPLAFVLLTVNDRLRPCPDCLGIKK